MKTELVKITELKEGDVFSFRTFRNPVFWRFIKLDNNEIMYEEIRSKYPHRSASPFSVVLKQIN